MTSISPQSLGTAEDVFPITPADNAIIGRPMRAIGVRASGDVAIRVAPGTAVVTIYVSAGSPYPVNPAVVMATGTTATGLVGLV